MKLFERVARARGQTGQIFQRYPNLSRIIQSIVWLSADKLRLAVSLFVTAWMARFLSPEGFGKLNYALALTALAAIISDLGLETITVRNLVRNESKPSDLLGTVFILRLLAAAACYLSLLVTTRVFFSTDGEMRSLLLVLGASMIFQPLLTIRSWFQAELLSKYVFAANNIAFVVAALARVMLILYQRPLVEFAWLSVAEIFVMGASMWIFFHYEGRQVTAWRFRGWMARQLLSVSWPLVLSGVAVTVYMRVDQAMIGAMIGSQQVGIYSAAVRISEICYLIPTILAMSLFPSIVRIKQHSEAQYFIRLQQYFNLSTALAYCLTIPSVFLAPWIIHILYGNEYGAAYRILIIHLWANVFVFQGVAREQFLLTEGFVRFSLAATLTGAVANVMLNLVLIPRFGGIGAAIATIVSYGVAAVVSSFAIAGTRRIGFMQLRSLIWPFNFQPFKMGGAPCG